MRTGDFLKLSARILAWGLACIVLIALIWLAVNRLSDERPDPRRDGFLRSGDGEVSDAENIAIGVAGLGAPRGADFMKFGVEVKKLYDQRAPWPDIQQKLHGSDELKLTVESRQLDCWMDPDWPGPKGCLPIDRAPQALAENREIFGRYKALYRFRHHVSFGQFARNLIPLTKLAVVEMRLDMRNGHYEAAYAKWRENFKFTRDQLRGQDDWVGKAIGSVDFGISHSLIEDLLVKEPSLGRVHADELLDLMRPEGIEMINPAGLARAENLDIERFFKTPYVMHPEYEDRLEWLGWKLGQPNRVLNRHLAYSMVYSTTLRQPWTKLADEIARVRNQYESLGWEHLIDPFGSIIFFRNVYWQLKPNNSMLRQVYIQDGRLRLTTLVVRILKSSVKDRDIPAFLTNVERELYDPFSEKPMRWDSKKGRIYFMTGEDGCSIAPFRVPVWDVKGGRQPPKPAEWAIC